MATTLAMPVAVMTVSSKRKLPKVIWPIESENDRIRRESLANADGMAGKKLRLENRNNIYDLLQISVKIPKNPDPTASKWQR
jgi:hypothetical protein